MKIYLQHIKKAGKIFQNLIFVILLFCSSSLFNEAKADHIAGDDMWWDCTGTPGVYHITFIFYRTCTGIPLCPTICGSPCSFTLNINGADPGCNGTSYGTVTLSLTKVADVGFNPLCPNAKNICNNMGCVTAGSYTPGLEGYTFEGNVNLGSSSGIPPTCCNVNISWSSCCRSAEINTGSTWAPYYTYCTINRCAAANTPCNSAPHFTNDPIALMCAGQPYIFNNGAFDPDGDSLSFNFVPSLASPGVSVPYTPPYSPTTPMPYYAPANATFPLGISCDSITGDIAFTPVYGGSGMFVGVMAMQVIQWRTINGVPTNIGVTRRDIQMWIIACAPNNPPWIRTDPGVTYNIPKLSWQVCAGNTLCFDVIAKDTDFPTPHSDTTYLSWNNTLAQFGATFKPKYIATNRHKPAPLGGPREDIYTFCWTPTDAMARNLPYYFTVNAKDDRCPNPGSVTRAFSVKVLQRASVTIHKNDYHCAKWSVNYTKNIPSQSFTQTIWHVSKVPNDYTLSPTTSYTYINQVSSPVLNFPIGGKYLVELDISTPGPAGQAPCFAQFYDTLLVDTAVKPFVNDTFVCIGNSVTIPYYAKWGHPSYFYRWFQYPDTFLAPLNSPYFITQSFTLSPPKTTRYTLQVRDLAGCRGYDSNVMVYVKPLPTFILPDTQRICYGSSYMMDFGNDSGRVKGYMWSTGDTTQTITRSDSNSYVLTLTDTFYCQNYDTFHLYVNAKIPANAGPDTAICHGDTATLRASGGMLYEWKNLTTGVIVQAKGYNNIVRVNPIATTSYEVRVYASYPDTTNKYLECSAVDTVQVMVNPLPQLTRPQDIQICKSTNLQVLGVYATSPSGGTGVWSYPAAPGALTGSGSSTQVNPDSLTNIPSDTLLYPNGFPNWIHFKYIEKTQDGGCTNYDSAKVIVYGVPPIKVTSDVKWCLNGGVFKLQPYPPVSAPYNTWYFTPYDANGVLSVWTGPGVSSIAVPPNKTRYEFDPQNSSVVLSPQKNTLTYTFTKTYATLNSPTCVNQKQVSFEIIPVPKISAGILPPMCNNDAPVNISTAAGSQTTGTSTFWLYAPVTPTNGINNAMKDSQNFDPSKITIPTGTQLSFKLYYNDLSTGCAAKDSLTATVVKVPTTTLTFTDPTATNNHHALEICRNSGNVFLTHTGSPVGGSGSFASYPSTSALTDAPPNQLQVNTSVDNTVIPAGTPYKIKYTYSITVGTASCKNSDSATISVDDPPVLKIASGTSICPVDSQAQLKLSQIPVSPYTYVWSYSSQAHGHWTTDSTKSPVTYQRDSLKDIPLGQITVYVTTNKPNNCPVAEDSANIVFNPQPTAAINCQTCEGCEPLSSVLNAQYAGMPVSYLWTVDGVAQTNSTPDSILNVSISRWTAHNIYKVQLQVTSNTTPGCVATSPIRNVTVHAKPIASITSNPTTTTVARPYFDFTNATIYPEASNNSFLWNFGPETVGGADRTSTDENPKSVNFAAEVGIKRICFKTTTQYGCSDTACMEVTIDPDITVFIPNAFYPNADPNYPCPNGDADCDRVFKPAARGYQTIEIFIFNRWGQQVFHTTNADEGWNGYMNNQKNGTPCPQDVYIYQINATSYSGKSYKYSGSITLLR